MKQVEPMLRATLRLGNHGQRAANRLNTKGGRLGRLSDHKD